ncbi:hypothetical protein BH10ACT11_BH10ACT11_03880 [soil metagenome]
MRAKTVRMAGLAAIIVAAIGINASSASGGVLPDFQNNVNSFKVGKYRVGVDVFTNSASVSIFNPSKFLNYRGDSQKDESGRIKGDFGNYGKVDLRFHKSGPFKDQKLPNGCTGTPNRKQKGTWKGVLKVKSEKSIVKVTKHEIKGSIVKPGNISCDLQPFPDLVSLTLFKPLLNFQATVRQSGGKPKFLAFVGGHKGGADIVRGVFAKGKPSDFKYAPDYTTAKVTPPAPYSGTGTYAGTAMWRGTATNTSGPISGNLKARFLGLNGKKKLTGQPAQLGEGSVVRGDAAASPAARWGGHR